MLCPLGNTGGSPDKRPKSGLEGSKVTKASLVRERAKGFVAKSEDLRTSVNMVIGRSEYKSGLGPNIRE